MTLFVSASQLEVFGLTNKKSSESCERKWWFKWVQKLPTVESTTSQDFGTVIHSVLERFLRADDLGRDSSGNAVNLYPENWYIPEDRFNKKQGNPIPEEEREIVKKLVEMAVSQGVVERVLNRVVEHDFKLPLVKGSNDIIFTGFIDLMSIGLIADHKSTSSPRYIKSEEGLSESIQMMGYAKVLVEEEKASGLPTSDPITLRHNVFIKPKNPEDEPQVRAVETTVTVSQVETFWKEIQVTAIKMKEIKDKNLDIGKWRDIKGPNISVSACRAFGAAGCPYQLICGGAETPQEFTRRVNTIKMNQATGISVVPYNPSFTTQTNNTTTTGQTGGIMNPVSSLRERLALQGIPVVQKTIEQVMAEAPVDLPKPAPTPEAPKPSLASLISPTTPAPSAPVQTETQPIPEKIETIQPTVVEDDDEDLDASDLPKTPADLAKQTQAPLEPFNTAPPVIKKKRGRPPKVRPVVETAPASPTPSAQNNSPIVVNTPIVQHTTEKKVENSASQAANAQGVQPQETPTKPITENPIKSESPPANPLKAIETLLKPVEQEKTEAIATSTPLNETTTTVSKTVSMPLFVLFEHCSFTKNSQKTVLLSEVLKGLVGEFEKGSGKKYYATPYYERKDQLFLYAEQIVRETIGNGDFVVVDCENPDVVSLGDAIRPWASTIVRGK